MADTNKFSVSDLILEVPSTLDPSRFDLDEYEDFISLVSGGRVYQEESLRKLVTFLAGGQFRDAADLASYSWKRNPILETAYGSFARLLDDLPFRGKLACSIDLATGTGKSFVMYGLARILLNEGTVDRALVLCPSITIEGGLLDKFRHLSADRELRAALPKRKGVRNPEVIQATSTVESGKICIENIHAVYAASKSAIAESLAGKGSSTLVLNDEAHHIYSPTNSGLREWKVFLDEPKFNFRRIAGFSGTCYTGNDYFSDVVHRYSLAQAIEEKAVKRVWYVDQDVSKTETESFQKIVANHEQNRKRYRPIKPLTILVTKDIRTAADLANRFTTYLRTIGIRDAVTRALVITSHKDHLPNLAKLDSVDLKSNPVEWIFSVSMLSEGWDVKNVFQIVPHEQRAFNSKLLIAQVLGRGLRLPGFGLDQHAEVTVFNHERWAPAIRHLVDEVMENDARIAAYPVSERKRYDFVLHQLVYKTGQRTESVSKSGSGALPKVVTLAPQAKTVSRRTHYVEAGSHRERETSVRVNYRLRPISAVADRIRNRLKTIDLEEGTAYASKATRQRVEDVIRKSLLAVRDRSALVSEENEQKLMAAFGPMVRSKATQRPRLSVQIDRVVKLRTSDLPARSVGLGAFRKEAGLFYDELSLGVGEERERKALALLDESNPYGANVQRVSNPFYFKVPTNVVLATHKPERQFIRELLRAENAKAIDAWVKASDTGFYEIDFSWRKGQHQRQGKFNPDFFIELKSQRAILVVETKADADVSEENRGKLKYARDHFDLVNKSQKSTRYHFFVLSPKEYDLFFQRLRDGTYKEFQSELETALAHSAS